MIKNYNNTEILKQGVKATIIGKPNVGKSSIINKLIGEDRVIVSDVAGTTRNSIHGVYNDSESQIVFVDTPGIHKPQNKLGRVLNKQAYFTINDVDIVVMVVDISEKIGRGDNFVIDILKNIKDKPVFLVINKIDKLPREEILKKIENVEKIWKKVMFCVIIGTYQKWSNIWTKKIKYNLARKI